MLTFIHIIQDNLNKNYDAILREIDIRENRLNTIKFKTHTLENDFAIINEKLENINYGIKNLPRTTYTSFINNDEDITLNKDYITNVESGI